MFRLHLGKFTQLKITDMEMFALINKRDIKCDVPQGSNLGLLLCINLYMSHHDLDILDINANNAIKDEWFFANKLALNANNLNTLL